MKLKELSIAIIAKKEKENIELFLHEILEYSDDVFVVDSNSNDGTKELCSKFNIRYINDNNLGKGDAQRVAANHAKYENIIFFDGDGSHDHNDIPRMYEILYEKNTDCVITSRITGGSLDVISNISFIGFLRFTGSNLITLLFNRFFKTAHTETLYSFRGIKKKVFHNLKTKENGFGIELEMLYLLKKFNYNTKEFPSREKLRKFGYSKLNTISGIYFIYLIIKYYLNYVLNFKKN
tara:strand:- start:4225 stop:4932 length:708 start_codon:yes stop_codon:yes gene_type:complete